MKSPFPYVILVGSAAIYFMFRGEFADASPQIQPQHDPAATSTPKPTSTVASYVPPSKYPRPETTAAKEETLEEYALHAPPEYQAATLDAGHPVEKNGPEVKRVKRAVNALRAKFPDSRRAMCDMAVRSHELMEEKGVQESVVEVLENARASVPSDMPKGTLTLAEVMAAYTTLRIDDR